MVLVCEPSELVQGVDQASEPNGLARSLLDYACTANGTHVAAARVVPPLARFPGALPPVLCTRVLTRDPAPMRAC